MWEIIIIPFLGTALGAASVFLFKKEMGQKMQRALTGFASGVMVSASFSAFCFLHLNRQQKWENLVFFLYLLDLG
jgi:ZIP family zinc transporter